MQIPTRASDPGSPWIREYRIRIHFVDPDSIEAAFGISMADVAQAVGKVRGVRAIARELSGVIHSVFPLLLSAVFLSGLRDCAVQHHF